LRDILEDFKAIAFTHKNLPLELVGKLHLSSEEQAALLARLKSYFGFNELLFLSTCNRVELLFRNPQQIDQLFVKEICLFINDRLSNYECDLLSENAELHEGQAAVEHLLRVASSLESLVVGEREIITQVRKAYDFCNHLGLTGDFVRLLMRQTIETAKDVYTNTDIAKNPVSVVSLAYRELKQLGIKDDARVVFVGSGETNVAMAGYLQKHKFANFAVFNRTLSNAEKLAGSLKGTAHSLATLDQYNKGFDVLIVCTDASSPVITPEVYHALLAGENGKKIVIDLGLPSNVEATVLEGNSKISYIDLNSLKERASENLKRREKEIIKCEEIIRTKVNHFIRLHRERKIELAFGEVPRQVKAIKELALTEVFLKEINSLDEQSKEVLDKVLSYLEKKYNAVAIKTAKEYLLNSEKYTGVN
jgi:glutamyl-tRNA reductase